MASRSQDVVVIGGGIHGCAVARELALRGRQVLVLERSIPGAEASSVAGGILGPHLEADGGPLLDLGAHSLDLYPAWAAALEAETGLSIGFEQCGGALVGFGEEEDARLTQRRSAGTFADLTSWEPALSNAATSALAFPTQAQVDPPSVMAALPRAAEAAGVRFVRDTVGRIESGAVIGRASTYVADHIIVAAGAWSTAIPGVPLPTDTVRPARGQIVELQTGDRLFENILFSERGYVLSRPDGRVLAGSTLEFVGFRKGVTVDGLRTILDIATELIPALAQAEVSATRSGFRPFTDDHLPLIGPTSVPGLWMLTGHYRNGILLAPGSAVLLADLMDDTTPAVDAAAVSPRRYSSDS
jgi:glycine oxidase